MPKKPKTTHPKVKTKPYYMVTFYQPLKEEMYAGIVCNKSNFNLLMREKHVLVNGASSGKSLSGAEIEAVGMSVVYGSVIILVKKIEVPDNVKEIFIPVYEKLEDYMLNKYFLVNGSESFYDSRVAAVKATRKVYPYMKKIEDTEAFTTKLDDGTATIYMRSVCLEELRF